MVTVGEREKAKRLRAVEMRGTIKRCRENGLQLLGSYLPFGSTLLPLRLRLGWLAKAQPKSLAVMQEGSNQHPLSEVASMRVGKLPYKAKDTAAASYNGEQDQLAEKYCFSLP